jgi:GNAT superfamily N-acetyltransferase
MQPRWTIRAAHLHPSLYTVKPRFGESVCRARLADVLAAGDDWFVCEHGEAIIGWVVVQWLGKPTQPGFPDLSDLYVREDWRGRGVGATLLAYCEAEALRRGYSWIGLSVNPTLNPRAHQLYTRLGYVHDGSPTYVDGVYDGDEDWVIDLIKRLGDFA